MNLIRKKSVKRAISTATGLTMVVWMCGLGMLAPVAGVAIADDRPSVTVDGVTVYDGDLISSNATNPDGTPTYESLDIYISKVVSATETYKRLVLNPSVFNSYGHLVWGDVAEVNSTVMDSFTTSDLARQDGTDEVYSLVADDDTGTKHWVNLTETQFIDEAGADNDSIYTINGTDTGSYTTGAAYTVVEDFIARTVPADDADVDGELTVSLSSDTPAAATLPKAASGVEVTRFNLTAGEATNVDSITIRRAGVGATTDLANVYLYEGATRLTSGRSIGSSTNTVEFANLAIEMTAGEVKTLSVKVDVATAPGAGVHSFEIESASVVEGPGEVLGSFPVRGNSMSIGSQSVSTVIVTKGTTPSDPTVGEVGAILSEFKLAAGVNDVSVESITLIHSGSTSSINVFDLELYAGTELVASAAEMTGDYMVFDFDEAYTIAQGITRVFQVKGTLAGRSGFTVKTYVEYSADVLAVDATYGVGAAIDIGTTSGTFDGSTTGTKYIEVTSQGGRMTIAHNGPSTGDVSKGGKDVYFYEFAMTASEQQVEVKKIGMTIDGTAVGGNGYACGGTTETFTDLKIIDVDTGKTLMGPKEYICASDNTTSGEVSFTDSFYIDAGETRNLAFTVDIRSSEATALDFIDDSFATTISAFTDTSVREVASGQYLTASTDIVPYLANAGNSLTIRSSSLALARASTPVNATVVKRAADVQALGLNFTAGSDSAANVSAITLRGYGNTTATSGSSGGTWANTVFNDIVSTVSLWDGDTQIGVTKSPTATGVLSFTSLNWDIAAGATKKLTVKADVTSSCGAGNNDYFYITLNDTDVTATDDDSNTITLTGGDNINGDTAHGTVGVEHLVRSAGTLSAKVEGSPDAAIVVAGSEGVVMAKYKLSALYEGFTIEKLEVASDVDGVFLTPASTYDQDLVRVGLRADGVTTWTTVSAGVAKFSGLDISVPADGSVYVEILADLNTIAGGAVSGDVPRLGINRHATNTFRAVGAGSSTVLTRSTLSGASDTEADVKEMTLRKTAPTIAKASGMSTALINGENTIYGVNVAADAGASVSMKRIAFTLSISDTITVNGAKFYQGSNDITSSVSIRNAKGENLKTGGSDITTAAVFSGNVYVTWDKAAANEEIIPASGDNTYYLKVNVSGAVAGKSIATYIADDTVAMADDAVTTLRSTTVSANPETTVATPNATAVIVRWEDTNNVYIDYNGDGVYTTVADYKIATAVQPSNDALGTKVADTIIPGNIAFHSDTTTADCSDAGDYFFIDVDGSGAYNATEDYQFAVYNTTSTQTLCDAATDTVTLMTYSLKYNSATADKLFFDIATAGYGVNDDLSFAATIPSSGAAASDAAVASSGANFIWSDNSNTSHATTTADWTNGYLVNDLSTSALNLSY